MMRQGSLSDVVTRSGLILDDRYRLDERIAAGGVGQVWRATDLLLERPVAVKVLRPEYSDHQETIDRFRKEARHAGAISNGHVAQVYDYGPSSPDGSPYLVMEYVDGPSLADLLAVDPIEPARALDIIAQAADGLSAAHKVGLVHRDVKPGNILISREGQVKVTDFGIAHAAGQVPVTGPGLVMGTTQYMAPERIAGRRGTAASDVYALGIVLHECLTGVPPHDGTPAEVMAAHLYLPLPPLPAGTPPEVEDLVARLTVKDPAQRISDARELADLAAMARDSVSGVPHLPPARTGAHSASGAGTGGSGSIAQVGALAADSAAALAGGSGLDSPTVARAAAYGTEADRQARGSGGGTAVLPPRGGGSPPYLSDEWNVPPRMSLPTEAGQPKPPQRRKSAALAVSAGVLASAGLVALLVSGAFTGAPTANQQPATTPATGHPTLGRLPSPSSSAGSARSSQPAGGATNPGAAANPGVSGSHDATPSKKASTSPSAHPSGTAGPTSGTSPATTPSSTPSSPASTTPSDTPTTPSGSTPTPTKTGCFLGICL
jgi:eukaryotic-like serine/threonine-protein kinase